MAGGNQTSQAKLTELSQSSQLEGQSSQLEGLRTLFSISRLGERSNDLGHPKRSRNNTGTYNRLPLFLETWQTVPGALASNYFVPVVKFTRHPVWVTSITLVTVVLVGLWKVVPHLDHQLRISFLAITIPLSLFKLYGWALSVLDKPAKTSRISQARLDKLRVVVSVPVYNEDPHLLDRCLWAIANQTRKPQRVDVVDDGSKENYAQLRKHWERWHGDMQVTWTRQANAGKRRAHTATFISDPHADIFITVDSDTTLVHNAIEEGLKPFANQRVKSVAGIELGYNAHLNLLTVIQNALQQLAQAVIGAAWSVTGDMFTNRGPFALYDAVMVRNLVPLYWGEEIFGRRVILGDDSLLSLAGSMAGRSVQQLSAFGLTMWPEKFGHHVRQRVRWARGRTIRNFWRLKYLPITSYTWWFTVVSIYTFLSGIGLAVVLTINWPVDAHEIGLTLIAIVIFNLLGQLRCLCFRNSSENWMDRCSTILVRPLATLWSIVLINHLIRPWGTMTFMRQGWTTRQQGAEIVLTEDEMVVEGTA